MPGLTDEVMTHPADAFTADTLHAGEVAYYQSVQSIPIPSWAMVGVTDWLTINIDLLAIIGGAVVEPHIPVPSINTRVKVFDDGRASLAVEAMFHHLWDDLDDQLPEDSTVRIDRDGTTVFARVNGSFKLTDTLRVHASAGATWCETVRIENRNRTTAVGRTADNEINPDGSIALDWRPRPWLSLHLMASYGTTFVYLDLVPRKVELGYGIRVAPFYAWDNRFLKALRIEGAAFAFYFQDAKEWLYLPIPIFPVAYWQWTF